MQKGDVQSGVLLFRLRQATHHQHGQGRNLPQAADKGIAIKFGHHVVCDDNSKPGTRLRVTEQSQSLLGRSRGSHRESGIAQHGLTHLQLRWTVVNEQDLRQVRFAWAQYALNASSLFR